jgi:hypothetical protein
MFVFLFNTGLSVNSYQFEGTFAESTDFSFGPKKHPLEMTAVVLCRGRIRRRWLGSEVEAAAVVHSCTLDPVLFRLKHKPMITLLIISGILQNGDGGGQEKKGDVYGYQLWVIS